MIQYYKLIGKLAVPCSNMWEWAYWFENSLDQRRVDLTEVGPLRVSTVFLSLDHDHFGKGPSQLFETMISSDEHDWLNYQTRCETWGQAEAMHQLAVDWAKAKLAEIEKEIARLSVPGSC